MTCFHQRPVLLTAAGGGEQTRNLGDQVHQKLEDVISSLFQDEKGETKRDEQSSGIRQQSQVLGLVCFTHWLGWGEQWDGDGGRCIWDPIPHPHTCLHLVLHPLPFSSFRSDLG